MHAGTLSLHAQEVLARLGASSVFTDAYLVGGTALALQLGHRKSYDFDFCTNKSLKAVEVSEKLSNVGKFIVDTLAPPHTLIGEFEGVKVSLFAYNYPLLDPFLSFAGVSLASVRDIAAMKLTAICGRAKKRDYMDIYIIARRYSFEEQFGWYDKKFGVLGNNAYTLIKALGYFEDAENDDVPEMLLPVTWEQVKTFLFTESMRLAKAML
ncbi:MAG TPA: nucleotidyl transferase AbiEii/AbiGii toxin family protein [Patescibacteria group bacterium]|uniref:Nucleotidyl transferase AbiEii/AbiGii toxin family protein n=1 Tax=Candidatus Gottesmanbacteria bacterium GW2011_GWA1_47_8 TaxID=1618438 RepID=A0A0G1THA8_9BACT|nr:MAG: hypothetical protein UY08_C0001G0004 [Candidatus Gottesmanbacteria bacterium GW2011_GWA1_47_8]HLD24297.1 nucleotidyl transferase AbiEii/AbiGii toxin family protein [Patescibacteria group bacterium]